MKKSVIRITAFLIILTVFLYGLNSVFKLKYGDGIYCLTKFYEQEDNTIDVLFLGSSHAFESFNTGTMWDECGIASYVLGGAMQPMWNTYYYLKEALKTQSPKLIVIEAYETRLDAEEGYVGDNNIIKNNYGLRLSPDKIESLKVSIPEGRFTDFFPEYGQYHSRYKEIEKGDFLKDKGDAENADWKGYGYSSEVWELEHNDVSDVHDRAPLIPKTEEYFRATINLAKEHDIPVLVVVAPYAGISPEHQVIYNTVESITNELGATFVNFNFYDDEIGMDYSVDVADPGHLNHRGSSKFSAYIAGYIKDNYDIPDHRGDNRYDSWARGADYIRQMICDQELTEETDIDTICQKLDSPVYWRFVSVNDTSDQEDPEIYDIISKLGITDRVPGGIWYINQDGPVWNTGMDDRLYLRTDESDFCLKRTDSDDGDFINSIIIDRTEYSKVENGINIVVYDTMTKKVADVIGIDADDEYKVVR